MRIILALIIIACQLYSSLSMCQGGSPCVGEDPPDGGCSSDFDCSGYVCDISTGTCVQCTHSGQCLNSNYPACIGNQCKACQEDNTCPNN